MKTFKQSALLLMGLLLLAASSCKKTALDSTTPSNILDAKNAQEANINVANARCLVTHTEDDLFGYTLDIFYNKAGDPDSMSFFGNFPVIMQYDCKGRLITSNYGTGGVHFDYIYKDNCVLPAAINYYISGLVAVYKLDYNNKGQIIKVGTTNLLSPEYNAVEKYEYNDLNNVTRVTYTRQNGTSSYVENEATKYDNRPAFMGGNKWLKFILYNSGVSIADYFRMFSKNNPLEWTWGYDGGSNAITATYEYDKGFAIKGNFHLFDIDGVTEILAFTELSSSTCDAAAFNPQPRLLKKKPVVSFKKAFHLPSTVPAR